MSLVITHGHLLFLYGLLSGIGATLSIALLLMHRANTAVRKAQRAMAMAQNTIHNQGDTIRRQQELIAQYRKAHQGETV